MSIEWWWGVGLGFFVGWMALETMTSIVSLFRREP